MAHIICSSESHNGAFLYLAHTPRTSVVIHSGCNIRAFLFDSVLLHIFSYEATFISSYFCPLNVSIHSLELHLWISIFPFSSLIISWCNFCVSSLCLQHINAQFGVCCRCNVFFFFASIRGKLISVFIHRWAEFHRAIPSWEHHSMTIFWESHYFQVFYFWPSLLLLGS